MHALKIVMILFCLNLRIIFGADATRGMENIAYVCLFDEKFLKEMHCFRFFDAYVLSPELDPELAYKVEINEGGIFFRRIPFEAQSKVPVLVLESRLVLVDIEIKEGGLKLEPCSYDTGSSPLYYKARDYLEFEGLEVKCKSDLFCVINGAHSIVTAFRVLFNPEPRRPSTKSLPASTITMKGKISGDLSPSELYIHGVRWLQLAINPGVVYEILRKKLARKKE